MRKNFAVTLLTFAIACNLGTGLGHRFDRRVCTIESSLRDTIEDRICAECLLETERRLRGRVPVCHRA